MTIKTKRFFCLVCMILAVGSFLGISAYFVDTDQKINQGIVGGNRIELIEEFKPPEKLEPGTEFTKNVKVKNTGISDCYLRIKAVFTDSDMEQYCYVNFNLNDYVYCEEDGFYYYNKILKSGMVTPSLFTRVSLSKEITSEEIKDFDILIYTESYQAARFQDYQEAWAYFERNKPKERAI